MNWETLDWDKLIALRSSFLAEDRLSKDYWTDLSTLEHFDFTFGQRILWKWRAVLDEAKQGWSPPDKVTMLDWGCGTAIAAEAFLGLWKESVGEIRLWDRSALALEFSQRKLAQLAPGLPIVRSSEVPEPGTPLVLLLSHLINELREKDLAALTPFFKRADAVLWVEPGTPRSSKELILQREKWKGEFQFLGPCPHAGSCGLLPDSPHQGWCHHFAPPPQDVFTDGNWVKFGKRLKIDLRSLPVSYLSMVRGTAVARPSGRVLGRARIQKGFATALVCRATGVREERFLKRNSKHYEPLREPRFANYVTED